MAPREEDVDCAVLWGVGPELPPCLREAPSVLLTWFLQSHQSPPSCTAQLVPKILLILVQDEESPGKGEMQPRHAKIHTQNVKLL